MERLLAQPDIFETLVKIGKGQIKSFDDLDMNAIEKQKEQQLRAQALRNQRSRGDQGQNLEDLERSEDEIEILKIEKQPISLMGGKLRDYQLEGLNWLFKLYQANLNGILADEMGLGKTIQSISILSLIESLKTAEQKKRRYSYHIIIVPKVTLGKWYKEIKEWVPSIRLF